MSKTITIGSLVTTVNLARSGGWPLDQSDFDAKDWAIAKRLGALGLRLPQITERWENIALAEKPFGDVQPFIDAKAESIQPQGLNAFRITGYNLIDDVVYVAYCELGTVVEDSWMEIGQFSREFRLITQPQ